MGKKPKQHATCLTALPLPLFNIHAQHYIFINGQGKNASDVKVVSNFNHEANLSYFGSALQSSLRAMQQTSLKVALQFEFHKHENNAWLSWLTHNSTGLHLAQTLWVRFVLAHNYHNSAHHYMNMKQTWVQINVSTLTWKVKFIFTLLRLSLVS